MARLPIIVAPDPRLKGASKPVETVGDEIRTLMDDMLETMYDADGIGLAAPQVGVQKRVIVVDVAPVDGERMPIAMANPEVIWESEVIITKEEGCLSLPDHYAEVHRPATVKIRYIDRENEIREMDADGMFATCVQHEIDHLDGVLFVDHVSSLKRNMILKKLTKAKKQGALDTA